MRKFIIPITLANGCFTCRSLRIARHERWIISSREGPDGSLNQDAPGMPIVSSTYCFAIVYGSVGVIEIRLSDKTAERRLTFYFTEIFFPASLRRSLLLFSRF